MELVTDLTLVIAAALVGGALAQRLRQPLLVGYILAGVAIGPFTGGLTVTHVKDIEELAEVGVALLLFSLGLEVSFRDLAPVRSVAIGGAVLQIVLTMALGLGLASVFGWPWPGSLWFGAVISLSSTMVALKTLQAQGRLGTVSSRVMLGLLVVQDLAVVPLMIVLPELSTPAGGVQPVIVATVRALVLLAVIVVVATQLVPRLMSVVARWNTRELFLLSITVVALGVGYAASRFGLSLALGAFVAGLVINESQYAHQALSDITPLRDLFGMLFFVSVGMLLDPAVLWSQFGTVILVVAAVIAGKGAILAAVVRAFGYRRVVPLAVGLTLFQVGEFAFVLARAGRTAGAIDDSLSALILNVAIATMALTPLVSAATPWLYARTANRRPKDRNDTVEVPSVALTRHVIVAGAGRVGCVIAEAMSRLTLPYVLIELDDRRVQQGRAAGLPIIYGDASHPVVLEASGIADARALLVAVRSFSDVRAIVDTARRLRPDLKIVARADSLEAVTALYSLGVEEVTSPELEAAVEMTRQALAQLDVPATDILQVANAIRREHLGPRPPNPGAAGLR